MKKSIPILAIFLLVFALPFASALCTTSSQSDATDYFGVNTGTVNTTAMAGSSGAVGTNELFTDYTYFTPRLNFTIRLTESINGKLTGENTTFATTSFTNFSSTLDIYNSTNLIDPSNYTLINPSGKIWAVVWNVDEFNGISLSAIYNRTMVACKVGMTPPADCDDLIISPSGVRTAYTTASFLTLNSPAAYGDDATFKLNSATPLASYMNNSNWAVGWDYTEQTCTTTVDCSTGVNHVLFYFLAGMFMIGMIIFIIFAFKDGIPDPKTVVYAVVAFLIMLVGLVIINGLINAVCNP